MQGGSKSESETASSISGSSTLDALPAASFVWESESETSTSFLLENYSPLLPLMLHQHQQCSAMIRWVMLPACTINFSFSASGFWAIVGVYECFIGYGDDCYPHCDYKAVRMEYCYWQMAAHIGWRGVLRIQRGEKISETEET